MYDLDGIFRKIKTKYILSAIFLKSMQLRLLSTIQNLLLIEMSSSERNAS